MQADDLTRAETDVVGLGDRSVTGEAGVVLPRQLGVWSATALNIANMVGIGPFITIPLFIAKMPGPQALIAWLIAAVLVVCDGLVWSELGAKYPGSGGSYHFLKQIFGGTRWGRLIPFLFIWQFLVSGTLEMASGYIGAMQYLEYIFPSLKATLAAWQVPGGTGTIASLAAMAITWALCQPMRRLGGLAVWLCVGTLITVAVVIGAGLANFRPELLTFPEQAWRSGGNWLPGLGGAMLIAVYDYLGYYNVCHLGDEVRDPARTIPRAVLISVVLVAAIYLTMNLAIIGVVPWAEAMQSENIAADFMERLYGRTAAVWLTVLILWTVVACMFAIQLGYSRIPFAAARHGDFFPAFARLDSRGEFPVVSLVSLGLLTALFCHFPLDAVIQAAVTVRIVVQFLGQIAGLAWLHQREPRDQFPFRMWLYPIPLAIALVGWLFILASADAMVLLSALGVVVSGIVVFLPWGLRNVSAASPTDREQA